MEYELNKGIGQNPEFKGLKAYRIIPIPGGINGVIIAEVASHIRFSHKVPHILRVMPESLHQTAPAFHLLPRSGKKRKHDSV